MKREEYNDIIWILINEGLEYSKQCSTEEAKKIYDFADIVATVIEIKYKSKIEKDGV